jgi:DNA-binding NtrC family response regulator
MVAAERFRGDLLFRLNGMEIVVPPLRERGEDVRELAERFLDAAAGERDPPRLGADALAVLRAHRWPGNVRELKTVLTRLALASPDRIDAEAVRGLLDQTQPARLFSREVLRSGPLDQLKAQLEREYLIQLHADAGGDLRAVASALGISLQAVYKKLKSLGLRPRELG